MSCSDRTGNLFLQEVDLMKPETLEVIPLNTSVFFHVASSMDAWAGHHESLYHMNVIGTQNVVDISLEKNIQKIVLTSGLGAFWSPKPDQCQGRT